MTVEELARLVLTMREIQKEFFDKSRRQSDTLRRAYEAERRVDATAREVLGDDGQGRLF